MARKSAREASGSGEWGAAGSNASHGASEAEQSENPIRGVGAATDDDDEEEDENEEADQEEEEEDEDGSERGD